jgi:cytochrome P450
MVSLRLGPRRIILLNHPDLLEQVLLTQNHNFIKHFAMRINPLVFGQGLLSSEGDFWLRQRRLIQPAFTRQRVSAYGPTMVEATRRLLASWVPGRTVDIYTEMMRLTLAITARTLFDADVEGDASKVGEALERLQENFLQRFQSLLPLPLWIPTSQNLRIRGVVRRLDQILYRFIEQRRQTSEARKDLLSILLHARDEGGGQMSDRQLRDEAMTIFLAGHETTALALSWAWYLLGQHPPVEERLAAEVRDVLGERLPTADDVPRLSYVEKVVQEAMRLYPPVYVVGREAVRDCEIGGFPIPRGMTLLMSQWVLHRDPRFFEEPEVFRPERWTEGLAKQLPKFAYFPFGGGPRVCIGNTFAMMEMVLVLATIAQQFCFTFQPGQPVVPWPTFTLRPQHGIPAVLSRRPKTQASDPS